MHTRRRLVVIVCTLTAIAALTACSTQDDEDRQHNHYRAVDGPVGDLYRLYFESGHDPADYTFDVLLYLDHINVPNPRYSYPYLRLMNTYEFGGLWEAVGFDYYEFNDIPVGSGFPADPCPGWKVRINGASVSVCSACYTNGGHLDLISLYGDRDAVEFIWDPSDSLVAYVRAVQVGETP